MGFFSASYKPLISINPIGVVVLRAKVEHEATDRIISGKDGRYTDEGYQKT